MKALLYNQVLDGGVSMIKTLRSLIKGMKIVLRVLVEFKKIVLIVPIMVDAWFPCVYHNAASGRSGDRGPALSGPRKVRTP